MSEPEIQIEKTVRAVSFSAPLGALYDALVTVGAAVSKRPPHPVLAGMLIEPTADGVWLHGFDYETSIRVLVAGAQLEAGVNEGRVLVSHAELAGLVKAAGKGEPAKTWRATTATLSASVELGTRTRMVGTKHAYRDGQRVVTEEGTPQTSPYRHADIRFTAGGFGLSLTELPLEDYPTLPAPVDNPGARLLVHRDDLLDALTRVSVAAGHDETFPQFMGVQLTQDADTLTLYTNDRYRAGIANVLISSTCSSSGPVLPPMAELLKVIKKFPSGGMSIELPKNSKTSWLTLRAEGIVATVRLSDLKLPACDSVIPREFPIIATLDRKAMALAVDKAMAIAVAMSDQRWSRVRLSIVPDGVIVTPSGLDVTAQVTSRMVEADVVGVHDARIFHITFNAGYLVAGLKTFSGDKVTLGCTVSNRQMLIAGSRAELDDQSRAVYRHLIMPTPMPA